MLGKILNNVFLTIIRRNEFESLQLRKYFKKNTASMLVCIHMAALMKFVYLKILKLVGTVHFHQRHIYSQEIMGWSSCLYMRICIILPWAFLKVRTE